MELAKTRMVLLSMSMVMVALYTLTTQRIAEQHTTMLTLSRIKCAACAVEAQLEEQMRQTTRLIPPL